MIKEARHAHERITSRTNMPRHMVHVLERRAKGLKPGSEYYMPLRRGRDTLGYAVFGVYGGRPTMKTVLAPHMRPSGTEMGEFQVKTSDMIKHGSLFELGVRDAMEKQAGTARGAIIGGALGAGTFGLFPYKKKVSLKQRLKNALVMGGTGALLGANIGSITADMKAARSAAIASKASTARMRERAARMAEEARREREKVDKVIKETRERIIAGDYKFKPRGSPATDEEKAFESFMKSRKTLDLNDPRSWRAIMKNPGGKQ